MTRADLMDAEMGWPKGLAFGRMSQLWLVSQDALVTVVSAAELVSLAWVPPAEAERFLAVGCQPEIGFFGPAPGTDQYGIVGDVIRPKPPEDLSEKRREAGKKGAAERWFAKQNGKRNKVAKKNGKPRVKKPPIAQVLPPGIDGPKVWDSYATAYRARYGVDPVRNQRTNGICLYLIQRVGVAAADLVAFYLKHSHSYYVSKAHDLGLCLTDCEGLHTQMLNGQKITQSAAAKADKSAGNLQVFQNVAKLWDEREKEERHEPESGPGPLSDAGRTVRR